MNVLITGAQFDNKGAQSLLFSVVNEIKYRYKDVDIYYVPLDDITKYEYDKYSFRFVLDNQAKWDCIDIPRIVYRNFSLLRKCLKIRSQLKNKKILRLSDIWNIIDIVVDISGYNLSSKWSMEINNRFLRYIKSAKKAGIPVVLMPQSFGPFDYKRNEKDINAKIKNTLGKVDVICAREKEGYQLLRNKYYLFDNVFLFPDLVLSSRQINPDHIFTTSFKPKKMVLPTTSNVGIIPNEQLLQNGKEKDILQLYQYIVDHLVQKNNVVYIFRHSNDLNICRKIYEVCKCDSVKLIDYDFDCFEYSLFVKNFKYIVASRYHSIVHAYKSEIPAVILGWSIKYNNLAKLFGQSNYVADIQSVAVSSVIRMIDSMESNLDVNRKLIASKDCVSEAETCYTKLWEIMDRINTSQK